MEILIKAGQLILSLSILIVLHEFGHYLPAKWFKTRVEKFYLFFDYKFSLFKKKIGETTWGIGWIPLGGYVKISGMIDESMDKEQMKQPPQPWEFRSKPAWQRLIIMIGGVVVNMIVGIVIYIMVLFTWGEDYLSPEHVYNGYSFDETYEAVGFVDGDNILAIDGKPLTDALGVNKEILLRDAREITVERNGAEEIILLPEDIDMKAFKSGAMQGIFPRFTAILDTVIEGYAAREAGFEDGDSVVAINGQPIRFWDEFVAAVKPQADKEIVIDFYRAGKLKSLAVTADSSGTIGVQANRPIAKMFEITHKSYSFAESIPGGLDLGVSKLSDYVSQMKFVFTEKGASSLGGFGTFGSLFSPTWDWHVFWSMTAFISIMLAFMNFLPIPALDGGHIMFLLYEMITGRKPNEKVMEYAQMFGIILLLGLLLYANGNDVYKYIFGGGN
ncbi:RIP metalloprotease RseP [Crocinitomix algicola]|uniref:RIP metalloprotease RseP n=1 Tax=Crocinitomix algicola TaxID=1740263 RepID=UPI00083722CB|nr:RIP metalloprotease RseP [Crocinitomix algicola]